MDFRRHHQDDWLLRPNFTSVWDCVTRRRATRQHFNFVRARICLVARGEMAEAKDCGARGDATLRRSAKASPCRQSLKRHNQQHFYDHRSFFFPEVPSLRLSKALRSAAIMQFADSRKRVHFHGRLQFGGSCPTSSHCLPGLIPSARATPCAHATSTRPCLGRLTRSCPAAACAR